jgi:hypothetical protein
MGELSKNYPDDLDAATLYAESMMNCDRGNSGHSTASRPKARSKSFPCSKRCCVAIQITRARITTTFTPLKLQQRRARTSKRGTAGKDRAQGRHLVHMPSHIYIRTGDYYQAAQANVDAIAVDREYIQKSGNNGLYPAMYYNHNIHFLAAASAMKGRYADSIKSARDLEANVKPVVKAMPMLEMFLPVHEHVSHAFQQMG